MRTCDNHCDFCFIYQLPKGLRKSLYLKDDDYRLSFLYGNFTTLTRFTEADLERIITDRISPLNVSVHSADPELRARMLRNDRGAISLRWMKVLLESGIRIRAQIVLSPEVNDGVELDRTLTTILDEYPGLDSVAIVPLGLSKFNPESHLRVHTRSEAEELIAQVFLWQSVFSECLGHPMVFAADEFYILADQDWPAAVTYGDFSMYEDGIGMVRHLQEEFNGHITPSQELTPDFFHSVDLGAKYGAQYERNPVADTSLRRQSPEPNAEQMVMIRPRARHGASHQKVIMTGEYGYVSLVSTVPANSTDVTFLAVKNNYFGGNTAVTGLLVGEDINIALAGLDSDCEIYLPDVCLSDGRFLDGKTVADLVRPVHVVPTNGHTLRQIIEG